jgi:hypothetical protein
MAADQRVQHAVLGFCPGRHQHIRCSKRQEWVYVHLLFLSQAVGATEYLGSSELRPNAILKISRSQLGSDVLNKLSLTYRITTSAQARFSPAAPTDEKSKTRLDSSDE